MIFPSLSVIIILSFLKLTLSPRLSRANIICFCIKSGVVNIMIHHIVVHRYNFCIFLNLFGKIHSNPTFGFYVWPLRMPAASACPLSEEGQETLYYLYCCKIWDCLLYGPFRTTHNTEHKAEIYSPHKFWIYGIYVQSTNLLKYRKYQSCRKSGIWQNICLCSVMCFFWSSSICPL